MCDSLKRTLVKSVKFGTEPLQKEMCITVYLQEFEHLKRYDKIHWRKKLSRPYWSCSAVCWICPEGQCFCKMSQIIKRLCSNTSVKNTFINHRHVTFLSNTLLNSCNRFTSREKLSVCKQYLQILSVATLVYSFVWKRIKSSDMKWIPQVPSWCL